MPGRKFSAGSAYRYGFNGKENDNEVEGEGNQQDYGFRIYDPRLVKFLTVDPLTKSYPYYTPYQFAANSPISGIDIDGLEYYFASDGSLIGKFGTSTEVRIVTDKLVANTIVTDINKGLNVSDKLYTSNLLGTASVIKEVLDVNKRTDDNGGYREESSVVNSDNSVLRGPTGPLPTYPTNAAGEATEAEVVTTLPTSIQRPVYIPMENGTRGLTIPKSLASLAVGLNKSEAIIHSHTNKTKAEFNKIDNSKVNFWPFTTSINSIDISTFGTRDSKLFIITGRLTPASIFASNGQISINEGVLGATYYDQQGNKQFDVKMSTLKKIDKTLSNE